jgi:hypothetical protein
MLTKEQIGKAWRESGTRSNSPPDWAIDFAQRCARSALEEAAKVCDELASSYWDAYKHAPIDDVNRANPHVEGMSDGAENCANAIRALREKEPS